MLKTFVIADFTNTTGDPVFDQTLRQGLAVQLGQSPFLSIVPDDRIRRAAFRAIYGQDALSRYAIMAVPPIHIIVENGNVTLEGLVGTAVERTIAGAQANGVPGVFSVTNTLRVEN